MSQAIHPQRSALLKMQKEIRRAEEAEKNKKKGLDPIDISFQELADMPGWKQLKKYMERQLQALKPEFDFSEEMSDDDFFKSYGMRTMVHDILSDFINRLINRVEDAQKEVKKTK